MKIFANGVQVFHFWDGRWRLTDAERKYALWTEAIGNFDLTERLFGAALNLAEERRGGLLVVLDDPSTARKLVSRTDLVIRQNYERFRSTPGMHQQEVNLNVATS
jgi:ParB-like chromosome segregation protein Spo0J